MRRKSLILILIVLSAGILSANAEFRYGLKLGGMIPKARLFKATDYSISNKSGFSGGVIFEYQKTKSGLAADAGISYTSYNIRLKDADNIESIGNNFIEIPIHLKYKFWLSKTNNLVAPMVYTGPSFLINLDNNKQSILTHQKFNTGWDIGLGIDIINFIQLSAGYRFGFDNYITNFPNNQEASLHANGWTVSASLLFDF